MKKRLIIASIASLLFALPLAAKESGKMYQAAHNANVRAAPTTNSQRIGYLKQGSSVRVIGSAAGGNWHQIGRASCRERV